GRRAGGGAVGGVGEVPRVAGDVDIGVFGRGAAAEFRRGGAADDVEPGLADAAGEVAIGRGAVAVHQAGAHFLQPALHGGAEVFHQIGHAGQGAGGVHAVLQRVGHHVLEHFDDAAEAG